jgi:hypothetical protein
MDQMTMGKKTAPDVAGDDFVRMYPCNQLKPPVHKFEDTFSAMTVVKAMFSLEK